MLFVNFNALANFAEKKGSLISESVFLLQVVSRKVVKGSVAEGITCWINK